MLRSELGGEKSTGTKKKETSSRPGASNMARDDSILHFCGVLSKVRGSVVEGRAGYRLLYRDTGNRPMIIAKTQSTGLSCALQLIRTGKKQMTDTLRFC
jgi:hypothetical protein